MTTRDTLREEYRRQMHRSFLNGVTVGLGIVLVVVGLCLMVRGW